MILSKFRTDKAQYDQIVARMVPPYAEVPEEVFCI